MIGAAYIRGLMVIVVIGGSVRLVCVPNSWCDFRCLLSNRQLINPHNKQHAMFPLQWRLNGRDCVSNHQPRECSLNRLIWCRSKKTSKLRVTGLCAGNSPGTGEFPAQLASYAENVSIWWRHHAIVCCEDGYRSGMSVSVWIGPLQ